MGMKYCIRHPDREVTPFDVGDQYCRECFMKAWSAGAAWADAHWDDRPAAPYKDEQSTDGRSILRDHRGEYRRKAI
jgi:hypothetical protein